MDSSEYTKVLELVEKSERTNKVPSVDINELDFTEWKKNRRYIIYIPQFDEDGKHIGYDFHYKSLKLVTKIIPKAKYAKFMPSIKDTNNVLASRTNTKSIFQVENNYIVITNKKGEDEYHPLYNHGRLEEMENILNGNDPKSKRNKVKEPVAEDVPYDPTLFLTGISCFKVTQHELQKYLKSGMTLNEILNQPIVEVDEILQEKKTNVSKNHDTVPLSVKADEFLQDKKLSVSKKPSIVSSTKQPQSKTASKIPSVLMEFLIEEEPVIPQIDNKIKVLDIHNILLNDNRLLCEAFMCWLDFDETTKSKLAKTTSIYRFLRKEPKTGLSDFALQAWQTVFNSTKYEQNQCYSLNNKELDMLFLLQKKMNSLFVFDVDYATHYTESDKTTECVLKNDYAIEIRLDESKIDTTMYSKLNDLCTLPLMSSKFEEQDKNFMMELLGLLTFMFKVISLDSKKITP